MKQLIFMILVTGLGTVGAVVVEPFLGVIVYYGLAVLRPQHLWRWVLPDGIAWSYYVALATIIAAALSLLSSRQAAAEEAAEPQSTRRFSMAHGLVLAFGAWVAISYIFAQNQQAAFRWLLEYGKIFVMFAVSTLIIRTLRQLWALFLVTAIALGYIAYEVNVLYLFDRRLDIYREGYGGLDNNGAALMLAMGVPLCVFAFDGCRGRLRWLFAAFVPLLLHAVLMTYSRGAMVSLIVTSPLLVLGVRNRRIAFAGVAVVLMALPWMAGAEIRSRFLSTAAYEEDGSAQSRLGSWRAGLQIAIDHPIVGVGPRGADLLSRRYGADREGRAIHNQYLQIAADLGFVGLLLYLFAIAVGFRNAHLTIRGEPAADESATIRMKAMARGTRAALAVFVVGSMFLSLEVFELPYLLILIACQLPLVGHAAKSVTRPAAAEPRAAAALPPAGATALPPAVRGLYVANRRQSA